MSSVAQRREPAAGTSSGTAADDLRDHAPLGQTVLPLGADTGDPQAIGHLFETLRGEVPRLNVFVANAGSGVVTPFLDLCWRSGTARWP